MLIFITNKDKPKKYAIENRKWIFKIIEALLTWYIAYLNSVYYQKLHIFKIFTLTLKFYANADLKYYVKFSAQRLWETFKNYQKNCIYGT